MRRLMQQLERFLATTVDGYLLNDIETLKNAQPSVGSYGDLTYPLLLTTLSGIELLGALLSPNPFKAQGMGAAYFENFWCDHLYHNDVVRKKLHEQVYKLARHGLAHSALIKGNIYVYKSKSPGGHLSYNAGALVIDATQLADDFVDAYKKRFVPIASGSSGREKQIATRLSEIQVKYTDQAAAIQGVAAPPQAGQPSPPGSVNFSGASGPAFPSQAPASTLPTSPGPAVGNSTGLAPLSVAPALPAAPAGTPPTTAQAGDTSDTAVPENEPARTPSSNSNTS